MRSAWDQHAVNLGSTWGQPAPSYLGLGAARGLLGVLLLRPLRQLRLETLSVGSQWMKLAALYDATQGLRAW